MRAQLEPDAEPDGFEIGFRLPEIAGVPGQEKGGTEPLDPRRGGRGPGRDIKGPQPIRVVWARILAMHNGVCDARRMLYIERLGPETVKLVQGIEKPMVMGQVVVDQAVVADIYQIKSRLLGNIEPFLVRI